ncbi:MAG: hypothetical protein AAF349_22250, partial [Cyanobacteria bacterium P01_A01_bin.68]
MGQCQAANSLYNCGLYEFKQRHYKQLEKDGGYSTYWKGDEYRHSWKLRRITATVMMPTARLIKRLGELCDEYGIKLIVTSEEYTSKASFKHLADLPKYG